MKKEKYKSTDKINIGVKKNIYYYLDFKQNRIINNIVSKLEYACIKNYFMIC